jgi:preprotein translocase subunit YajC
MKRNLRRGDRVKIKGGLYDRTVGTVDSVVFQRTEDQLNEFHHGYHVILDSGRVVTVREVQVT